MERDACIYVAGSDTLVGAALIRQLDRLGYQCVIGATNAETVNPHAVSKCFERERPQYVFFAAGKTGGIHTNQTQPATLMTDNLAAAQSVMAAAHRVAARKLLYLGSACCYPRLCPQPMPESALLTGPPEPTNEYYTLAKLAGLKLCQAYRVEFGCDFICAIPANPFGIEDDFDPASSHVIAALLDRMHKARETRADHVDIWGTGTARREFVFADDLADACLFVMDNYSALDPINLGGGEALSIAELATAIKALTGFNGDLRFDATKPDGMPVKMLDSTRLLAMGWHPRTSFVDALRATYDAYLQR